MQLLPPRCCPVSTLQELLCTKVGYNKLLEMPRGYDRQPLEPVTMQLDSPLEPLSRCQRPSKGAGLALTGMWLIKKMKSDEALLSGRRSCDFALPCYEAVELLGIVYCP